MTILTLITQQARIVNQSCWIYYCPDLIQDRIDRKLWTFRCDYGRTKVRKAPIQPDPCRSVPSFSSPFIFRWDCNRSRMKAPFRTLRFTCRDHLVVYILLVQTTRTKQVLNRTSFLRFGGFLWLWLTVFLGIFCLHVNWCKQELTLLICWCFILSK